MNFLGLIEKIKSYLRYSNKTALKNELFVRIPRKYLFLFTIYHKNTSHFFFKIILFSNLLHHFFHRVRTPRTNGLTFLPTF